MREKDEKSIRNPRFLSLFIITIQLPQVEYLIDIQVLSSFCVDRKKKQERTANTLPLSFAQPTPRHLSWQTCEAVLIMTSSFRIGLNLRNLNNHYYSKISTNLCICFHDIRYLTEIIELLQAEVEIAMKDLQV